MDFGVYVHFPWCHRRCPYCDFAIAIAPHYAIPHETYADAVLTELRVRAPLFQSGRQLRSIYFGGGTPALWRADCIARVITAVRETFAADIRALEITVEANPNDCRPDVIQSLMDIGINRLSIGVQGWEAQTLVQLGRDHSVDQACSAVDVVRRVGMKNLSIDLIYAVPGLSMATWRQTLETTLSLRPEHLSVYQLTIEERTVFLARVRRGELTETPDEISAEQFYLAHQLLTAAGYEHYEVSTYALPGFRSQHNSGYWAAAEYLGLGNGAHSFCRMATDQGLRWSNHRSVKRYLAATPNVGEETTTHVALDADPRIASLETQDAHAMAQDALWVGLRTSDGIPRVWVENVPEKPMVLLQETGLITITGDRLCPTPRGLLFADEVAVRLLGSWSRGAAPN